MKKRILSGMLVLLLLCSILLPSAFAAEKGESAEKTDGLPEDGSYGVIYCCGEGFSNVMGYDITGGNAAVCAVELTEDGEAIKSLPNGTAIIKFVKNSDGTYYFMLGKQYLVIKDLDSSNKEKLALCDTAEKGAKWTIKADQAGMSGAYNIMNAEYKWNGKSDVYLEQYNNQKYCGYSYGDAKYFQFKFFETSADEDGRVGALADPGPLPETGETYVIYCAAAGMNGGVFGQQTDESAVKQDLLCAEAEIKNGTLAYEDIGNGALILTAGKDGSYYTFQTGSKWLGMTENYMDESTGKMINDESLILVDSYNEYCKWELTAIDGGWLMKNKEAQWKGNPVYIEASDDMFAGYSYDSSNCSVFAMRFVALEDSSGYGYVSNPKITILPFSPKLGVDCPIRFSVDSFGEIEDSSANYWFDGPSGALKSATAEYDRNTGSVTIPAAEIAGHAMLYVSISVDTSAGEKIHAAQVAQVADEPIITGVYPAANSATGNENRPSVTVSFLNGKENLSVRMEFDGAEVTPTVTDGKAAYTPSAALADGRHTVSVTLTREDGKTAQKDWSFFVGASGASLYFGQIHSHTAEYSDGAGTLEEAYEHAYSAANVDFLIVTDHSNYFDTTKKNSPASYYDLSTLETSGSTTKWEEAKATAAAYNAQYSGELVCAYGYEMTWSGGPGHMNTFNTYGTVSRNNTSLNNKTNYAGMLLYDDLMVYANQGKDINGVSGVRTKYIESAPIVSQFNHPGTTFGNFGDYTGYTEARDEVQSLIEVGNGSGAVGGSSYWPSYEEYDLCLSLGWHVAPTNNQDNHRGNWGDANTCRDVVLADEFTEEGIYNALAARRCYATEDQNLEIRYTMMTDSTEYTMGDIAPFGGTEVTLQYQISDPNASDIISTVYVIGENGRILATRNYTANSCTDTVSLSNTDRYYYLKIVQKDGQIAVTAPIWIDASIGCDHDYTEASYTPATCTADGERRSVCALCGYIKTEVIPALGHNYVDGACSRCGKTIPVFTAAETICDGDEVVIYNPGHGMAISNETDNNWYLVPVAITPEDDAISNPAENLVWTVVDNGDGTFSFTCGDNAIVAWLSGTYIELTNDANYAGADGKWIVSFSGDYAYIQSSTLSNSYGPAYIECYYNANKDKTNISGYTSGDPTTKSNDFGFRFYVKDGCAHAWEQTDEIVPTCTEAGSITYTCALCGRTETKTVPAAGHNYVDGVCSVCGGEKSDSSEVVIYYPYTGKVVTTESYIYRNYSTGATKYELLIANASLVDGEVECSTENVARFTLLDNGDGTVTFRTSDGRYLYADGTDVKLVSSQSDYTKYVLEEADGGVYIRCATATYTDETGTFTQYLEVYSGYFTVYGINTSYAHLYTFGLYPVAASCDHDWDDGVKTKDPTCTEAGSVTYTCSLCGETKTEEIPMNPHSYRGTVTTYPTASQDGEQTYTCTVCGETYTDTLSLAGQDDSLKIKRANLLLESDISICFYVLDSVLEGWETPYMEFSKAYYDNAGNITGYQKKIVTDYELVTTEDGLKCHMFRFKGICASEMSSAVTATLYAGKDGEIYEGKTVNYSVLTYATNMLGKSTDAKLKTMLVDLLNYGAASQSYVNYNLGNLANASLTAEQKAYATQQTPALSSCKKLVKNDGATVSFKTCNLVLKEKVTVNFYLNLAAYTGSLDDLQVVISYTGTNGIAKQVTIDSSELAAEQISGGTYYGVNFDQLNALQMRTELTAEVFSKSSGERISDTVTYSIESYAYSKRDDFDDTLVDMLNAMMKYGDSAEAYFLGTK